MSAPMPAWFPVDGAPPSPTVGARRVDPTELPAARWQRWWADRAAGLEDSPLGAFAIAQGFVVRTGQTRDVGLERHDVRREVRRGLWTPAGRGLVAPVAIRDDSEHLERRRLAALQAAGAVLNRPDHVISARSGGIVHGLPTMSVPPTPEITAPDQDSLGLRTGSHIFGAALRPRSTTSWFGAPVTDVARTIVDLARHDRRDGIMAVDAALREQLVTAAELERAVDDAAGWPGVRQAREVVSLGDGHAESPLESITRLALHDDGFPPVIPQVYIGGYWVDLLLPDQRLVIECDGRSKYVDDERAREKIREHRIGRLRFRIERVMWEDIVRLWPQTRLRLWAALYAP